MSSLYGISLKEAIPLIKNLYESLGLKSMILFKDNEWVNIITIINLTRRTVEDLSREYRFREERIGKIDYDYLKIIKEARPINEIDNILTEIEKGYLKIRDFKTKLYSEKPNMFIKNRIGRDHNILKMGEYAEYSYYVVTLNMSNSPAALLYQNKITPSILAFQNYNDLARSWLDLEHLDSSINIYLIIPIYATVTEIQYLGGNVIKATLKINRI